MNNKKGLSDVVTTLLIIVIALAAVVIVGSIVLRMVKNTGQDIEKATVCNTNKVELVNCIYTPSSQASPAIVTVSYRRISDEKVKADGVIPSVIVTAKDGSLIKTVENNNDVDSLTEASPTGSVTYKSTGTELGVEAKQAEASATFTLTNGQTQVCNSAPVTCVKAQ